MIRFEKILSLSRPSLRLLKRGLQKKPIEVVEPSKLDFLRTPTGRQASFLAYISGGIFLIQFTIIGPHRFLIEKLRQIFTGSTSDPEANISDNFPTLLAECIDQNEAKGVKAMFVCGNCYSQPKSFGESDQKVLLLIPDHFKNENVNQVSNFGTCKHDNLSSDYKSVVIPQDVLGTMVLSENAKKYAIQRELIRTTKSYFHQHGMLAAIVILSNYIVTRITNDRLNTFKLPLSQRLIFYGFTSLFHFYMYQTCSSVLGAAQELELVEMTARQSESLAKGGLEFYTKEKARNLAKRSLFPQDFEKKFNLKGDKLNWNLTRSLPLDERIQLCQNIIPLHQAGLN